MGDYIYLKGLQDAEISYFRLARIFFPYDRDIIITEGLSLIRGKVNNEQTYKALKYALKYDPYSIEMLGMYLQFANIFGTKLETINSYKILKQIGPNTNVLKEINKLNLSNLKGL